jgi:hypothetical protein
MTSIVQGFYMYLTFASVFDTSLPIEPTVIFSSSRLTTGDVSVKPYPVSM